MSVLTLKVNGQSHSLDLDPELLCSMCSATILNSVDRSSGAVSVSADPAR